MNQLFTLIEWFYKLSCFVLEPLLFATYGAFFLAVAVAIVNLLFRKWITATQMGLLWGLVLVRLVVPSFVESELSFQNLAASQSKTSPLEINDLRSEDETFTFITKDGSQVTTDAFGTPIYSQPVEQVSVDENLFEEFLFSLIELSPLFFGVISLTILFSTIVSYWSFRRKILSNQPLDDERISSIWKECSERADVKPELEIYSTDKISHPAIMGLFKTKLLLPKDATELSDDQLRMIMYHELAHVRRWDIAINWCMMLIRALHFWNPVYWIASARFQNLREQACDERAVRWMGGANQSLDYSQLLMSFVERDSNSNSWTVALPSSLLGFMTAIQRKFSIANRLKSLKDHRDRRHPIETTFAVFSLILVGYCGLTDAKSPDLESQQSQKWIKSYAKLNVDFHTFEKNLQREDEEIYVVTYKLDDIVEKLTNEDRTREEVEKELYWHFKHIIQYSTQTSPINAIKSGSIKKIPREKLKANPAPKVNESRSSKKQKTETPENEDVVQNDSTWVVRANSTAHKRIREMAEAYRLGGDAQIVLETRFVTADKDLAKFTGAKWKRIESYVANPMSLPSEANTEELTLDASAVIEERLPVIATTMSDKQTAHFVRMAQSNERSNILFAPKVTFFNGQSASISDCAQRPFVVGLETEDDGTTKPQLDVVEEGIQLHFRTIYDESKSNIRLKGRFNLNEIDSVKTADVLLDGKPHTIQIPRVKKIQMKIGTNLRVGETLLMGCFPSLEKKEYLYVLVTPRTIIDSTTMKPIATAPKE